MDIRLRHAIDEKTIPTLILPLSQEEHQRDHTRHALAKLLGAAYDRLQREFAAESGEVLPIYTDRQCICLLGLGSNPRFADILKAFRQLAFRHKRRLTATLGISLLHREATDDVPLLLEAAANGLFLGGYGPGKYKSEKNGDHPLHQEVLAVELIIASSDQADRYEEAFRRGWTIAQTQTGILDLVNAPSNHKTPRQLGEWALQSAQRYHYRAEVWDRGRIESEGMHALLAVNRGSEYPPAFIVLEYQPAAETEVPKVALVGKGVTFDTGGLSIKPSSNLHYMKSDMGGAAAVMGAIECCARLQLPVHVIGIIPATDNAVDARSIKPSDVIDSYSGKTIEIIDTDAEGRLILADGLAYAVRNFSPEILIDLATLTGSSVRALGYQAGALFSNNDQLADQLYQAGLECGERVWRLPLWDGYQDELKSDVADIRNLGTRPVAGAITAAKFLEAFIDKHPAWAHLDIAGMAFGDSEFAAGKSATAYGVRLLLTFLDNLLRTHARSDIVTREARAQR